MVRVGKCELETGRSKNCESEYGSPNGDKAGM